MRWTSLAGSAVGSLRQSPLQTVLSVLGLVIGVAALVAILSLIDGMERYARDQIEDTTNVQSVVVSPRTRERVDGVTLALDAPPALTPGDAADLEAALADTAVVAWVQERSVEAVADTVRTALRLTAAAGTIGPWIEVVDGRLFWPDEAAVVVSRALADRLAPGGRAVGQTVVLEGAPVRVVGVVDGDDHRAFGGAVFARDDAAAPALTVFATRAEDVPAVTDRVRDWLDGRGGRGAFEVASYESQAEQFGQAMLLFKLVMGLITGVSVVVGGVGVMNVLLMTVTERTQEIGVRKAMGARRRDVVAQFLIEAVAVSGVGSAIGVGAGLAVVFAAAPVLRYATEVPFYEAVTAETLAVVGVLAVVVGVVFGTYPALRASRLSPVEAIRHA